MESGAVKFYYFSQIHIHTFIASILFSTLLLLIPKLFKKINLRNYGTFLGFFILGFKILDSVYRVTHEHEPVYNVFFPVNAMFLKFYIAEIVSFIKPFELYIVVLILSMLFIMFMMYLPFRKKNTAI